MTKLMDCAGNVFAEGKNINEILKELNDDPNGSNERRYYYRPWHIVDAYYCNDGAPDYYGEYADETYDVIDG